MTSPDACLKILRNRRLKGSLFEDLNDPFELLAVSTGDKLSRVLLKYLKAQLNHKYCLLCFSEVWDESLMWAHYAAKHTGVCLGFDVRDCLAEKVTYVAERLHHNFAGETVPFSPEGQRIVQQSLYTKHDGWAYEKEWRVYTDQAVRHVDGNFYADFSNDLRLREVILGERCKLTVSGVAALLDHTGPRITIRRVRTAFTSFAVVRNQAVTPRHVGKG
jgi:hypothetical protein